MISSTNDTAITFKSNKWTSFGFGKMTSYDFVLFVCCAEGWLNRLRDLRMQSPERPPTGTGGCHLSDRIRHSLSLHGTVCTCLHMSAHVCESDRRSETPRHLWWLRLVGISGRPDGEPFSWTLHEAQRSCQPHFLDPKRASTCERYTMVIHWHMDHTVHPPSLVWHIFSLNQLNPWGWVFWGLWRSVLRAKKPKTLGLWKSPSCSTRQTRQTPSCTQFASTFSQTASLLHYPMHIQSLQKTSMELRAILRAIRESKWCGDKFHAGLGENRSNHVLHCLEVRK